jgi:hypothetical protein
MFNLSPREGLLLADLIGKNRDDLMEGLRHEENIQLLNGGQSVVIRQTGDGPTPIPTNQSMLQ